MNRLQKQALIRYAYDHRNMYRFTDEEWVDLLNCYANHTDVKQCARRMRMRPLDASILYCQMSQAVTEYAIAAMRAK